MTVREIADQYGVSARTVYRDIEKYNFEKGCSHPNGYNDQVEDGELLKYIKERRSGKGNGAEKAEKPKKRKGLRREEKKPKVIEVEIGPSKDINIVGVMLLVLLSADGIACAWIAMNTIAGGLREIAGAGFFCVGVAIGYAAFIHQRKYEGYNEAWAAGFFIFQMLLHLSAFEVFDMGTWNDVSFGIGKVMVSVAIPLATMSIGMNSKVDKK
jgi:hypothetical protein